MLMIEAHLPAERPALAPPGAPRIHWLTRWLDRWALSPVAPVIGTLTLAVAGLLGSLWTPEIRSAIPISWGVEVAGEFVWIPTCVRSPNFVADPL